MSTDVVIGIPRFRRKRIRANTERLVSETTKKEERFSASVERVKSAATAVEQASWQLVRDHDRVMRAAAWPITRKG